MTPVQNNPRGILFILLGMILFSIQDALIKFVYEDTALYELYFGRTLTAFILLTSYLIFSKQKIILGEFEKEGGTSKSHNPKSQSFFRKIKEVWEDLT